MIQPQEVVQNDFGYEIPFTLQDGNGNAVDLTNAVLTLTVQPAQDPTGTALTLGGSMAADEPTAGTCHYTVATGDFANPGSFLTTVTALWNGSESLTWVGPLLIVLPSLPKNMN